MGPLGSLSAHFCDTGWAEVGGHILPNIDDLAYLATSGAVAASGFLESCNGATSLKKNKWMGEPTPKARWDAEDRYLQRDTPGAPLPPPFPPTTEVRCDLCADPVRVYRRLAAADRFVCTACATALETFQGPPTLTCEYCLRLCYYRVARPEIQVCSSCSLEFLRRGFFLREVPRRHGGQ